MKEIEEGIHEVHAQAREQKNKQETQQDQEVEGSKAQSLNSLRRKIKKVPVSIFSILFLTHFLRC